MHFLWLSFNIPFHCQCHILMECTFPFVENTLVSLNGLVLVFWQIFFEIVFQMLWNLYTSPFCVYTVYKQVEHVLCCYLAHLEEHVLVSITILKNDLGLSTIKLNNGIFQYQLSLFHVLFNVLNVAYYSFQTYMSGPWWVNIIRTSTKSCLIKMRKSVVIGSWCFVEYYCNSRFILVLSLLRTWPSKFVFLKIPHIIWFYFQQNW